MSPFHCGRKRNRPWNGWLFWTSIHDTRDMPCSPSHVLNTESSGSSKSIFSQTHCRLPLIDDWFSVCSCVCVCVCVSREGNVLAQGRLFDKSYIFYSHIDNGGMYLIALCIDKIRFRIRIILLNTFTQVQYLSTILRYLFFSWAIFLFYASLCFYSPTVLFRDFLIFYFLLHYMFDSKLLATFQICIKIWLL